MKKLFFTLFAIAIFFGLKTQESVTLDFCYLKAIENYPLTKQKELLNASNDLIIKNLNKNYLPDMMVNGQIHYQSDVTKTPFQDVSIPGMPSMPTVAKDWYKITLDVNQVIYDGSITGRQKNLEEINLRIDQQNVDIELYKVKERINQIYFNVLLLRESIRTIELHEKILTAKLKDVESGIKNGIILASNADIIKAEIIQIEQSLVELNIGIQSSINILNELTALELNTNTEFKTPDVSIDLNNYLNNRPEFYLFTLHQNKLEASKKVLGSKLLPRLYAFGQAGYGRPGYDMLKNEFDDFYMIGARLKWNVWDWNRSGKEKEILDLQSKIIDTQKETYDKNIRIELQNKIAEIRKVEEMISRDNQIIELREKITKSSSSQLDNGVITSTEYLTELNAESKSKLDLQTHKIQLIKAKLDYKATLGNL
ncbi:MAG: TolC family protein [Bacteroidales bacterium]|nr:TolC family protein [Bacteroidales bacterium]